MINRTIAPQFGEVENIKLLEAKPLVLKNGIKAYIINGGDQDLVRIELIFANINWDVNKPLQAFAANTMLNDGTSKFTGAQIADKIDYYGSFLQTDYNFDQASVTLYTLNKHLSSTLPIIKAVVSDSVFPQTELDTFILNQKQKLSVNLEKNDFVSRKVFNKTLFGDTIYGYDINADDYDKLNQDQLIEYFQNAYQPKNCTIIISGKVTEDIINEVNNTFGEDWNDEYPVSENKFEFSSLYGSDQLIEKPDAIQSAIRIGRLAINRNHPDFPGLQVLNTVLGGYFGSRLMANIREDKGYTYGIGSAVVSLKNAGYFFIASEVGAEVCTATLAEIEKEINLLKSELVSAQELDLVRNYMLGSMLGSLENAFSHADKFKNVHFSGLDHNYYQRYTHIIRTITPEEILKLANQYLNFNEFEKVVVGKK